MKKFITKIDDIWHVSELEMPPFSTDVEFMDRNGSIHNGHIQIDMAGFYAYLNPDYSNFDTMILWRFIKGKDYPMYKKYE